MTNKDKLLKMTVQEFLAKYCYRQGYNEVDLTKEFIVTNPADADQWLESEASDNV